MCLFFLSLHFAIHLMANAIEFDTNPWITIENENKTKLMFRNRDREIDRLFYYLDMLCKKKKKRHRKTQNAADWWNNWDINCIFTFFYFQYTNCMRFRMPKHLTLAPTVKLNIMLLLLHIVNGDIIINLFRQGARRRLTTKYPN